MALDYDDMEPDWDALRREEEEEREQARREAIDRHMCPKCRSGQVKPYSAAKDACDNPRCDYEFRYPSAYPDDKEGNKAREVPLSEKYKRKD